MRARATAIARQRPTRPPQPPNAKRQSKLKTSYATGRPRGIPWPPCSFCRVSGALYPAKAGITARVNVVQRQGKITYKSVNGSCSRSHFLRVCKKRPYDIKKETYNSPDGEGRYVILLKRVKSWVLGCSSKVINVFPTPTCGEERKKPVVQAENSRIQ